MHMKSIQIRKDGFFKVSRFRKHRKSRPHAGSRRTRIIDRVPLLRGTLRVQPVTPPVHEALSGCDLVALESNYDLHMLRSGPYPYYLRARIESVRGHLSNDECAAKLMELIQEGCKKFALCHLSQENNTPMLALQTVFSTLGAAGVVPDKDCIVQTQRRNEVSPALAF